MTTVGLPLLSPSPRPDVAIVRMLSFLLCTIISGQVGTSVAEKQRQRQHPSPDLLCSGSLDRAAVLGLTHGAEPRPIAFRSTSTWPLLYRRFARHSKPINQNKPFIIFI